MSRKHEEAVAAIEALKEGFVEADVNPTEDPEKVKAAVLSIFPGAELQTKGQKLAGNAVLSVFKEQLEKEKIRVTICTILDSNFSEGKSYVDLHKLAAVAGRVSVDEEFPLGKIRLTVPWSR
jgi:hypothetical protein